MARPAYNPTEKERAQVKTLTGMGLILEQISVVIGISVPTLRKHFRKELDAGALEANAAVAQSLYRQATNPEKPNAAAGMFWLKCRAGWREYPEETLGKKQALQDAAEQAASKFRRQAPPKLVAANGKPV